MTRWQWDADAAAGSAGAPGESGVEAAAPLSRWNGGWFDCPRCDRVVTGLVREGPASPASSYSHSHCSPVCEAGRDPDPEDPWATAGVPGANFREVELNDAPPAHLMVHVPEGEGLPALLFLHGAVTYIYPESLWWDVRMLVQKNAVVREQFVVVAPFGTRGEPLAVVSETRRKATRFGVEVPYAEYFDEERIWEAFLRFCESLGPKRVDLSRLHVMGYSMGGQGAWNLAVRHGSCLASCAPFAGKCAWLGDSYTHGKRTLQELEALPIRSYCGYEDNRAYAWGDFTWIAGHRGKNNYEHERKEGLPDGISVDIFSWGDRLSLHLLSGTPTAHCVWEPVLYNEEVFGLFGWMAGLRCSRAESCTLLGASPRAAPVTASMQVCGEDGQSDEDAPMVVTTASADLAENAGEAAAWQWSA